MRSCALVAAREGGDVGRGCGRASAGRSRASPRSGAGQHERHRESSWSGVRSVGNLRSVTPTRKTDVPLQALGPVDGEQLDRVGLGRGGHVEALAVVVLGLELGQQRRAASPAPSTAWNSATAFTNRSRLSRRAAAAGLTDDASSTSMPVVSMIRRTRSRIGSPTCRPQPAQLGGEQGEPLPRLGGVVQRRPGRLERVAERGDLGRVGARRPPRRARPSRSLEPRPRPRCRRARAARRPSSARSRGPIAQRGPVSRVSSAALAVTSWSRVRVATTSATSGSRSSPWRPDDLDRDLAAAVRASKTSAACELSRVRTPISRHDGSVPWRAWARRPGRRSQASSSSYVS